MEKDDDWYGEDDAYDFGFRMYNPTIGRFMSEDPLGIYFPFNSPYAFAENDCVNYVDLEGLEKTSVQAARSGTITYTKPALSKMTYTDAMRMVSSRQSTFMTLIEVGGQFLLRVSLVLDPSPLGTEDVFWGNTPYRTITIDERRLFELEEKEASGTLTKDEYAELERLNAKLRGWYNIGADKHKNSNDYEGSRSVYVIYKDGDIYKFGIADNTNWNKAKDMPQRLSYQLDQLMMKFPDSRISGKVLESYPKISTEAIKKIETTFVRTYEKFNNRVPEGNKSHQTIGSGSGSGSGSGDPRRPPQE